MAGSGSIITSSQGKVLADGSVDPGEKGPSGLPKRPAPNPISYLFWLWVSDFVDLAYRKGQITASDIPYVRTQSEVARLNKRFHANLYYKDAKTGELVQRDLSRALLLTFKGPLILTAVFCVIELISKLTTPLFIGLLLKWFETPGDEVNSGIFYAVCLVLATFVGQGLVWAHSCMVSFAMGMDIRTVCNSQVYRKAMALSPSSRASTNTGELVTFLSSDSEKLPQTMVTIHQVWMAPLTIILGMVMLHNFIGNAAFVGLAVLIFSIPLQAFIAIGTFKAQKAMAKSTDERNNLVNEALQGIKILKMYGWEDSYLKRIQDLRTTEMEKCKEYTYKSAYMIFMFIGIPLMLNLAVFAVHYALDGDMGPSTIFTAISLMGIIRLPMILLPMTMQTAISASIALKRMDKFFKMQEIVTIKKDCKSKENALELEGVFTWGAPPLSSEPDDDKDAKPTPADEYTEISAGGEVELTKIDVEVPNASEAPFEISIPATAPLMIKKGELVAIVGTVGSGKSSLIAAALGELELKSGKVGVTGSVGLAAQTPWIVNNTLKGNIIMANPYDQARYNYAIACCALTDDIKMLPAGSDTEIGEKGINLSGGQRARVSLARTIYANPDIFILDDTLSAVDAHVGKHLFEKCIKKEMKGNGKTVLFATNQLHVLDSVDRIVVVTCGTISEIGTYKQLMKDKGEFQKLMEEFNAKSQSGAKKSSDKEIMKRRSSSFSSDIEKEEVDMTEEGKLIEKEGIEMGGVDTKVFELYFVKAVGSKMVIVLLILLSIAAQILQNAHEVMSSVWSTEYERNGEDDKFQLYFIWWAVLGMVALFFSLLRARSWAWQAIQASLNLHDSLLENVIACKMEFFDSTPMGRILNRFTKDFYMVDLELPRNVSNFIVCLMSVIGAFITIGAVLPWFFIVLGPILWYYYKVQSWYRPLSRDVQRVESASRSPIFASFSEAVSGVMTVRAFGMEQELQNKCDFYIDTGNNAFYLMHSSNRWLQVRLDALAGFTMSFVCVFVVMGREYPDRISVDAGTAGLMITFVQMVTGLMNWTVRMGCETEARITSVERIVEYSEMDSREAAPIVDSYRPPKEWPTEGEIEFKGMNMRYKAGAPLILKDINLVIPGGSKVGVAGRTGSGKSSLLVSLFRMAEPTSDSVIMIDGYNCLKGGLKDVRGAISIIPQDPVMFNGTVKSNVDPTDEHGEEDIMNALRHAELGEVVGSLEDVVEDGGTNYSVGQRQLFCLARALLRKTKILVLDEATANVDVQTDEKIQSTLRSEFEGCTVITIAHRLNTIADSDYILVMEDGRVGEFDSPGKLEKDKESMWSKLLKSEREK